MTRKKRHFEIDKIIEAYFGKREAIILSILLSSENTFMTAEEISEKTGIPVQFVYRSLYLLETYSIVENHIPIHKIETEKKYYWRTSRDRVKKGVIKYFEDMKESMKKAFDIFSENVNTMFYCEDMNALFDHYWADVYNYECPISGKYMMMYDAKIDEKALQTQITKIDNIINKIDKGGKNESKARTRN